MNYITKEVARMILADALAQESQEHEETKGMIERSQCDIMDTAPSFCSDIGIDFEEKAELLANLENLQQYTDLVMPLIELFRNHPNNDSDAFEDDDIASEIFHKLMGSGGAQGDDLTDIVERVIPCIDCSGIGFDLANEIIFAFIKGE